MYIIYGKESANKLSDRYIILELDTITVESKEITLYSVIDRDSIKLKDIPSLDQFISLHEKLIENLPKKDKNFCSQAIEQLYGKFEGELDSFYTHVKSRFLEW